MSNGLMSAPLADEFYRAVVSPGAVLHSQYAVSTTQHGTCTAPRFVSRWCTGHTKANGEVIPPFEVNYSVRCRTCAACRKAHKWHWIQRSLPEIAKAPRTWFVTLTFRAEEHFRLQAAALRTGGDLFHVEFLEVQKMFKRMRKAGFQFRYLLVSEAHKSGLPHFHLFLHEKPGSGFTSDDLNGIRQNKRRMRAAKPPRFWPLGFCQAKLVEQTNTQRPQDLAMYVCKYITKGDSRIRASLNYGKGVLGDLSPKITH